MPLFSVPLNAQIRCYLTLLSLPIQSELSNTQYGKCYYLPQNFSMGSSRLVKANVFTSYRGLYQSRPSIWLDAGAKPQFLELLEWVVFHAFLIPQKCLPPAEIAYCSLSSRRLAYYTFSPQLFHLKLPLAHKA